MSVDLKVELDDKLSAPAASAAGGVDALTSSFNALMARVSTLDAMLQGLIAPLNAVTTSLGGLTQAARSVDAVAIAAAPAASSVDTLVESVEAVAETASQVGAVTDAVEAVATASAPAAAAVAELPKAVESSAAEAVRSLNELERELLAVTIAEKKAQRRGAGDGVLKTLAEKRKLLSLDRDILALSGKQKQAQAELKSGQKGITEAGSGMPTLLGQITGQLLAAGRAAAGLAMQFGKSVIAAASLKDDAIRSMEAVLGNRDAAKSFVSEITGFKGADSFDAQALLSAGRSLVGGGFSESQAAVLIKGMASVSSVSGNDSAMFGQLTDAFGEINAKQALDMGKLIEISKASKFAIKVDDVVASIGAQSGQTAEEVRAALAKGQVGSQEGIAGIMQAIKSGVGKGSVGGAAAAGANTLGGLMAQIEKKFFNLVKPVEDSPGLMKMQGALQAVAGLLDSSTESGKRLQAAFDNIVASGFGALFGGGEGDGTAKVIDKILRAVEALGAVVGPVIATLRGFGEGLFEGAGDILMPLFDMIRDLQDLKPGSLNIFIESFKTLGKVVGWVAGFVALGIVTIVVGVAVFVDSVVWLVKSIPDAFWWVVDSIASVGSTLWGIGSDIVSGLWNGIKAGWRTMLVGFDALIDLLPDAVKKALRIGSPAKVMIPLGVNTVEGIGVGMEQEAPALRRQMEGVVAPLSTMAGGGLGGGGSRFIGGGAPAINITVNADGASREDADSIAERVRTVLVQVLRETALAAGAA